MLNFPNPFLLNKSRSQIYKEITILNLLRTKNIISDKENVRGVDVDRFDFLIWKKINSLLLPPLMSVKLKSLIVFLVIRKIIILKENKDSYIKSYILVCSHFYWILLILKLIYAELGTLEWWKSRSMLDPLFFVISRLT